MRQSERRMAAGMVLALAAALNAPRIASAQAMSPPPEAATNAPRPVEGPRPSETRVFDDWLLRCGQIEGGRKVCEIAQGVSAQAGSGGKGLVAQIVVGRLSATTPMRLVVQLPEGVYLPGGVSVEPGGKAPAIPLVYQRCVGSCFAEAEMTPAMLEALKAAREPGKITYSDSGRRPATLPLSFKGFGPALEASLKS